MCGDPISQVSIANAWGDAKDSQQTKKQLINELMQTSQLVAKPSTTKAHYQYLKNTSRVTKARLEHLFAFSPKVVFSFSIQNNSPVLTFVSENVRDRFGYDPQQFYTDPQLWSTCIHPDDLPRLVNSYLSLFEVGTLISEYRFRHANGDYRWVHDESRVAYDHEGQLLEIIGCCMDITDRKHIEEVLHRSEASLNMSQEMAHVGSWEWNLEDGSFQLSDELHRIMGIPDAMQLVDIKQVGIDRVQPEDRDIVNKFISDAVRGDIRQSLTFRIVRPDGEVRWLTANEHRVLRVSENGKPKILFGSVQDVTERKYAEDAMKGSHAELERRVAERTVELSKVNQELREEIAERERADKVIRRQLEHEECIASISSRFMSNDNIDEGIKGALSDMGRLMGGSRVHLFQFNDAGKTVSNSHEWCALGVRPQIDALQDISCKAFQWGLEQMSANQMIHIPDVSQIPPEAQAEKEFAESQDTKSFIMLPLNIRGKLAGFIGLDNTVESHIWGEEDLTLLRVSSQIVGYALERQRAEGSLRESERRFHSLYATMSEGVVLHEFVYDENGKAVDCIIVDVNPAYESIVGLSREKAIGSKASELYGPGDPPFLDVYVQVVTSGEPAHFEAYIPRIKKHYALSAFTPDGEQLAAVFSDITERKQAEELLISEKEKLQAVVDGLARMEIGVDIVGADYTILDQNQILMARYGDCVGEPCYEKYMGLEEPCETCHMRRSLETMTMQSVKLTGVDGRIYELLATPLVNPDGTADRVVEFVRDITERHEMEKRRKLFSEILQVLNKPSEKMDAIRDVLELIRESTGSEAVGIRLCEGEDYPYYQTFGFPSHFVECEKYLCARDRTGQLIKDADGIAELECMCGNIIRGRTDPSLPIFTNGGSFRTNSTSELLASTSEDDRKGWTRNRCNAEGYESVALVPLRSNGDIIGLLQFNDHRKYKFTQEQIEFFENIAASIGVSLARKQVAEALLDSEQFANKLIESSLNGIFIYDLEKRAISFMNPQCTEMTGHTLESLGTLEEDEFWQLFHIDDLVSILHDTEMLRQSKEGEIYENEYRFKTSSGNWMSCLFRSAVFERDDSGNVRQTIGTFIDITDRKRTEDALRESEANLQRLFQTMTEGVILIDRDGNITQANPAAERILCLTQPEIKNRNYISSPWEMFRPDGTLMLPEELPGRRAMTEKRIVSDVMVGNERSDGSICWVNVSAAPIIIEPEVVDGVVITFADVTEHKQAEDALRASEERFRTIIENADDAITLINAEGIILYESPSVGRITGYETGERLGAPIEQFVHPEDMPVVKRGIEQIIREPGVSEPRVIRMRRKDGVWIWFEGTVKNFIDDPTVGAIVCNYRDVTARLWTEEQIRASLREKEVLLQEIHHRVKNNLQVICSLLSLQSRQLRDEASITALEESQARVRAMALAHEQLYSCENLSRINFIEYIRTVVVQLVRCHAVNRDDIDIRINESDCFMDADTAIPLGLIASELVSNSFKHAFPKTTDSGKVKGEISLGIYTVGDTFEFSVKDNGVGLPQDLDLQTAGSLGLQLVNTLARQVKGTIEYSGSDGCEFKIIFAKPQI